MTTATPITTLNLATGEERVYVGLDARRAVIAAHAQADKGDYNTWNYEHRYGGLPRVAPLGTWCLGDWAAR